jgi:alpha-D-ribose 1-methylphosphonate 5-triphosphate synthase subunit PhnH
VARRSDAPEPRFAGDRPGRPAAVRPRLASATTFPRPLRHRHRQVTDLQAGSGWRLTGPGIETAARLAVDGLPPAFLDAWAGNRALFPRGVDLFLTAGDRVAALPRTVRVEG